MAVRFRSAAGATRFMDYQGSRLGRHRPLPVLAAGPIIQAVTAREVMTASVISVPPEATVRAVCELMKAHEIGAVVVVDVVSRVLGLVTDRDIVVRAVAARR